MKKLITIIFFLGFLGVVAYTIYFTLGEDLGIRDSFALFGGDLERGYPSAGYLISYEPNGNLKTCGYSALNNRVAVTASHCVDNSASIFIGRGDFSLDRNNHTQILNAIQKQGWIDNKTRSQDFAILNFIDEENRFTAFSEITSPREGCDMRVVAYGRTENPNEASTKPRKSAVMCASEIGTDTFIIQGKDAGICFGDSGSPVYFDDTENLVGVVASIVLEDPNETEPCAIGNRAIVVRADAQQRLINENIANIDESLSSVSVTDGLSVQVVDENLLERLGLDNLTEEQQRQYILYGAGAGISIMVIFLIILIVGGGGGNDEEEVYIG